MCEMCVCVCVFLILTLVLEVFLFLSPHVLVSVVAVGTCEFSGPKAASGRRLTLRKPYRHTDIQLVSSFSTVDSVRRSSSLG